MGSQNRTGVIGNVDNVLLLPDPLARPVEAVAADEADGEEVVGWAEAARGEVALFWVSFVLFFSCGEGLRVIVWGWNLVLDGLVATGWGQVLSHCFLEALVEMMLGGAMIEGTLGR